MYFYEQLGLYLRARFTLIVLATREEERALEAVALLCKSTGRPCLAWDAADGFQALVVHPSAIPSGREPLIALEQIDKRATDAVFVLKDFHEFWGDARVKRKLRNVARRLKLTKKSIIVTCPTAELPPELVDDAVVVEFPRPDAFDLEALLDRLARNSGGRTNLTAAGRQKLVQAALGMTAAQAQRVFAKALVQDGVLDDRDIAIVTADKQQIIRESEALELCAPAELRAEVQGEVGGLAGLKAWLHPRARAFGPEARAYGLPAPRGIALIGVPGTGKSLVARMVGGLWRLPVLRLDLGVLLGGPGGTPEERTRRALRLAEAVAPCVLWIDDIDRALAQGAHDRGGGARVLGAIRAWMIEKTAPCFVVATAGEVAGPLADLVHKGRFDEVFLLDLPTADERAEILAVHLTKRHRQPRDFDIAELAGAADGYVGAQIEQAVIDALYAGFHAGREPTSADIATALSRQVPVSVARRERVAALRAWLRESGAQTASSPAADAGAAEGTPRSQL